jgi:DNA polymerase-3 subunit epsilon
MRQIALDTETTGFEPSLGHRIIEIAAVELINRQLTGNRFHRYLNPERASDEGALQVHGLTEEFLRDKPKFREIVAEFLDFIGGAELIIHNAPFDNGFLDNELRLLDMKPLTEHCGNIVDTLRIARSLHPGKKNSLDALCERYQVDRSQRTRHGALIDTELLAQVYLAMTRGQDSLDMAIKPVPAPAARLNTNGILELLVIKASPDELAEHSKQLADIDQASNGACLWRQMQDA